MVSPIPGVPALTGEGVEAPMRAGDICLSRFRSQMHAPVLFSKLIGGAAMPKGEQKGNREAKKPKKEKPKTIAAAPSQKGASGPSSGSSKK